MKQLIMGTAGHIDHGKTTLVKLLSGIETDRLKEEKERGITIELGFAWLDLADGTHVGIVDVPGHEKFVRTMVAGAGGIDFVLLVIAADEGVMPQTREHFDICNLLKVKHGLVALTKSDMVDEEWLDLVRDDVETYLAGTFLEGAPIVPVSSKTGEGRQELLDAIQQTCGSVEQSAAADLFRLPVDRVFTMKGFGTVITGTCVGGSVATGEEVQVLPSGLKAKVRGLQVHGESVEKAGTGLRTAINFQGVEKSEVGRGEVIVKPGSLSTTYILDASIDYLPSAPKPLEYRTRVRFHHHTSEILARVVPLSGETIAPGQPAKVQLRLESPAVVVTGDRFVLRSYSPVTTIGGGVVLHPNPRKHRRPFDSALADLEILEGDDIAKKVELIYRGGGTKGMMFSTIPALIGITKKTITQIYRDLLSKGILVRIDQDLDVAVHAEPFEVASNAVLSYLDEFHNANPTLEGVGRGELGDKVMYGLDAKLLGKVLSKLEKGGKIKRAGSTVSLKEHKAELKGGMEQAGLKVLAAIVDGGYTPPTFKELMAVAGGDSKSTRQILDLLVKEQRVIKVSEDLHYNPEAIEELAAKVTAHIEQTGEIDAKGFKELSGTSRKYSIPLLEYFDLVKLTLRVGDKRVLRTSSS